MSSRITVAEICADLRLADRTVRSLLRKGTIPCIPQGRGFIITRFQYEAWKQGAFDRRPTPHPIRLAS